MVEGNYETIVAMDTSSVKFGPGVTQELGFELSRLGVTNVMLVTDQVMSKHESVDQAILSIQKEAIKVADSTVLGYILSKGLKTLGVFGLGLYLSLNYFN